MCTNADNLERKNERERKKICVREKKRGPRLTVSFYERLFKISRLCLIVILVMIVIVHQRVINTIVLIVNYHWLMLVIEVVEMVEMFEVVVMMMMVVVTVVVSVIVSVIQVLKV